MAKNNNAQLLKTPAPNPALKIFENLIAKWELKGRTLDSKEDNITGWTTFEWMPGGFFLKTFPASVYANMSRDVLSYKWDIQGNTLIHSGLGATYRGRGTISEDGNTITGGWRPNEGTPTTDGTAYDAVMVRVR